MKRRGKGRESDEKEVPVFEMSYSSLPLLTRKM